jgi:hypothetical protein
MIMFSKEEWEKAIEEGSEAMVQALKTFGPSETLNLLLYFSNNDPVLNQLLIKYPSIVAVGEFFSRMLVYKNRDDKVKEINVKRGCDDKNNVNNEGPSTLEDAFKCPRK